jgi:hypothetical protein
MSTAKPKIYVPLEVTDSGRSAAGFVERRGCIPGLWATRRLNFTTGNN